MKTILLKTRALCAVFVLAAVALASCAEANPDEMPDEGDVVPENPDTEFTLTTVRLASFAGNADRITYGGTRANTEGSISGPLELVASIDNPSKEEGFNFNKEENGRYMSASCVYYNAVSYKYYVTYHMQGNNYNTTLETDTAGAIQEFTVSDSGDVKLGDGFRAESPGKEDYDFNHIYFDNTDSRIIAVGHNVKDGNRKSTNAIIGVFDPEKSQFTYATVKTGEKKEDKAGDSLGYEDAGDVNCVVRTNDVPSIQPGLEGEVHGWNIYLVATRRGMAVLHADEENLFKPYLNDNGDNYFIKTPGSSKYISATGSSSYYGLLYLAEEHTGDVAYDTRSEARIACLSINTSNDNGLGHIQGWNSPFKKLDPTENILDFYDQIEIPKYITPIDGKNTLNIYGAGGYERYAALGVSGMYYNNMDAGKGVKRFDSRPVNCVVEDLSPFQSATKGFLYVANGSKVSILNNYTLEEVASYQAPSKDAAGNEIASSANFITVRRTGNGDEFSERIVTVAFGQLGVKIFKFTPPAN